MRGDTEPLMASPEEVKKWRKLMAGFTVEATPQVDDWLKSGACNGGKHEACNGVVGIPDFSHRPYVIFQRCECPCGHPGVKKPPAAQPKKVRGR